MKLNLNSKQKIYIIGFIIIAIAIIVFAIVFRGLSEEKNYGKYMMQASECISENDYDNAISYLRKAASIDDTDECLQLMSDCYEATGKYDKAIEVLRLLNTDNPSVSAKIAVLENKKRMNEDADTVTIGGEKHKTSETSLVLDNQNLGNKVIAEVAQLYSLNNLSLAGNGITDISGLSGLGGLTVLNLSNNGIADISPLTSIGSLRTLYLDNNPIENLEVLESIPSLRTLSLKGITLTSEQTQQLSSALPNCAINGDKASSGDETISIGGETFDKNITQLDLSGRGIIDFSAISGCEKLTWINLSNNEISDLTPLMDIPNITYLDISNNRINDLRPLMGLGTIKVLNVSGNNVTSTVSLGMNTALTELNISNNVISNFSGIKKLKNLTTLNLANSGFKYSDAAYFTYLSKLLTLNISDNEITGEDFESIQQMLPICAITHSDLVYTYDFGGYQIPSDTSEIELNYRGISDLNPILKFKNLTKLELVGDGITDLYPFSIWENWRTLVYLDLSSNNIEDLSALQSLGNLETLNLSDNRISNAQALYTMDSLRTLYIGGNLLDEAQILELNQYLPNCEIFT